MVIKSSVYIIVASCVCVRVRACITAFHCRCIRAKMACSVWITLIFVWIQMASCRARTIIFLSEFHRVFSSFSMCRQNGERQKNRQEKRPLRHAARTPDNCNECGIFIAVSHLPICSITKA